MTDAPGERSGSDLDAGEQRAAVRERYGGIAAESSDPRGGTAGGSSDCCGSDDGATTCGQVDRGYDEADLDAPGAELGLGCGNPTAIAGLAAGETVLDLGSGGGFDCFLAAREVGYSGRVIGVDMTPEMVETARENAEEADAGNVEFRLGEIEHLPVADESVDVVLSNCVLNLSPDKPQVFREAYRALRPGGRIAISDVVATGDLPAAVCEDPTSLAACVAGAATASALEAMASDAGFESVSVVPDDDGAAVESFGADRDLSDSLVSATIEAEKPTPGGS